MILFITLIIWIFFIQFFFRKGHYFFTVLYFVIGIYEIGGQIYLAYLDQEASGVNVHMLIQSYVTAEDMVQYQAVMMGFFLFTGFFYFFLVKYRRDINYLSVINSRQKNFSFLLLGLFIFGIISVVTNSGKISRLDYLSIAYNDAIVNPALPYGQLLLVCAAGLFCCAILNKQWFYASIIGILISPISYELFIAGRRQAFIPSALLIILIILYNKKIKYRLFILNVFVLILVALTAYQFNSRTIQGEFDSLAFLYQLSELPLIHITSLISFSNTENSQISFGSHYVLAILNSVPYFHLGDFLMGLIDIKPWNYDAEVVTPLGGLSMIADSILAFNIFGPFLLAFLIGIIAHYYHKNFYLYSQPAAIASFPGMLILPLGVMFIMYYRNGFSHFIKSAISFTIIYIFFTYFLYFIKSLISHLNKRVP